MQAQEKVGFAFLGESDAVREGNLAIIGAGQIDLAAISGEEELQAPRPIQSKLLLPRAAEGASGPRILTAVTRIQNDYRRRARAPQPSPRQERQHRFDQIQMVKVRLAIDHLRTKSKPHLDTLPLGDLCSRMENKRAVGAS